MNGIDHTKIIIHQQGEMVRGYTRCIFCDMEISIPIKIQGSYLKSLSGLGIQKLMAKTIEDYLLNVHFGFGNDPISLNQRDRDGSCPNQPIKTETEKTYIDHGMALSKDFKEMKEDQWKKKKAMLFEKQKESEGIVDACGRPIMVTPNV